MLDGIRIEPTSPPSMAVRWTVLSERGTETLATLDVYPAGLNGHRVDVFGVDRRRGQLIPACIGGETSRHPERPPKLPSLPVDFFPMVIVYVPRSTTSIIHAMIRPWGVL